MRTIPIKDDQFYNTNSSPLRAKNHDDRMRHEGACIILNDILDLIDSTIASQKISKEELLSSFTKPQMKVMRSIIESFGDVSAGIR